MSDDGFSDTFDESSIEIQVKSLMGTTFDIKVSFNDTIGAIKKKIYRVGGIPVNQQKLLFRSNELKDTATLCDSGLKNGSTLTLVTSMRGGPITMRKLSGSSEQYLIKELTGLFDNSGEEMLRSNVSLILFRKGDSLNLLRVVENEDGTYSPYSDNPISPPSKPSRKDKIDVFDRLSEDTEMCTKIATLRKNMKELNLKKRIKSRYSHGDCSTAGQDTIDGEKPNWNDDEKNEESYDSYKLMEDCAVVSLDNFNLTIFENNMFPDEANQSESEEIALKDKHRTKPKVIQTLPAKQSVSKHICNEKKVQCQPRENVAKTSKRRELLSEKFERSPAGYLTFSRNRNLDKIDDCQGLSLANSKSTNYDESLTNLDISLGNSCVLPSLTNLENKEVSLTLKNSQNQFLLEGLHSNKLPDLRLLDTDHLLTKAVEDQKAEDIVESNANKTDNGILNTPETNAVGRRSSLSCIGAAKHLPNLTNKSGRRAFGSFTADLASKKSTAMGSRTTNSANLMSSVPLASNYHMPSGNSPSRPPSTVSPLSVGSVHNKKSEHRSYTMDDLGNMVSHSSNSLDTSVHKFTRLEPIRNLASSRCESPVSGGDAGGTSVEEMSAQFAEQLHLLDGESATDVYEESLSVPTRNRVRLTRLVIASEGTERSKSSSDSIELDKHTQDFWEIHESASNRLKRSATCKVGVLKRHQEVEYNYDSLGNSQSNMKPDLGNFSKSSSDIGVCSGSANYCIPQYLAAPSAIPPQYAPKHHPKYCDLFFTDEPRSPLYSRKNKKENLDNTEQEDEKSRDNSENDCASIQRIKNDETVFESRKEFNADGLIGYYNLGCSTDVTEKAKELEPVVKLPAVVKKKSRCNHCNKRLNITNIYDCRCGKIFCSQHRYSEVHSCSYNYKTEGRKLLERQNPLVTAEKVQKL